MDAIPKNPFKNFFNKAADSVAKGYADSKIKEVVNYKVSMKDVVFVATISIAVTALIVTHSKLPNNIPNIIIIR